jgi:nucleoporin POM152
MNASGGSSFKQSPAAQESDSGPLIPTDWIDAPSQRFYAFALYLALMSWRAYDWNTLQDSEEQSLWLFMKWLFIDGTFLFGLPSMRIPWLEWQSQTTLLMFLAHAAIDAMLMFQIGIPVGAGFAAIGRSFWGAYEMAVNEHNVNPQSVMHNESLILGRQIIHILPEGSATLNANREAFCIDIDGHTTEARLPITINATSPILIDILRIDLDTQANETIHLSKSQIKTMHKEASRMITYSEGPNEPKILYHAVKKPGIYVLQKVIDQTNLEVSRKRIAHTVVVPCPKAAVKQSTSNKCKGELSDVEMSVIGTPPLRVKYRKTINNVLTTSSFESIQPEDFFSPLSKQDSNALVVPSRIDVEWARPRHVPVPLSEHLSTAGHWEYSIEEVQDGFGNRIKYTEQDHDEQGRGRSKKVSNLHQSITVHERPNANLQGCTPHSPLKRAKGKTADLPVQYGSTGKESISNAAYQLQYMFTPVAELSSSGEHSANPQRQAFTAKNIAQRPSIREPGLYTLTGVSTEFCEGEVMEPASCLLQNPPEPDLAISSEEIFDKCAGNPIGLRVDLDLAGTPPFLVEYKMTRKGSRHQEPHSVRISGHRGQIVLTAPKAGHYTWEFLQISDDVYKEHSLKHKGLKLEQDVKPSASAKFLNLRPKHEACINTHVEFNVGLSGERPFTLDYEIVHAGKRKTYQLRDIEGDTTTIATPPLTEGGDHMIALVSITDRMGCKEFLKSEAHVTVRHQIPKVAFSTIDGERSVDIPDGKKVELPLRFMTGDAPWIVKYLDPEGHELHLRATKPNEKLAVTTPGTYTLIGLEDAMCPGQVDPAASEFTVSVIPRPEMRLVTGEGETQENGVLTKHGICEGDEDAVDMLFKGLPPYKVQYVQAVKPTSGTMSPNKKDLRVALNVASLRMDTGQAGEYKYSFNKLGDMNYNHAGDDFSPLHIKQQVFARPTAAFKNPGKTYSFCSSESEGEEVIPVQLTGKPPFTLEVELKHIGSMKPETVMLRDIGSLSTSIKIPRAKLYAGKSSVALRRVSDSNSCSRTLDTTTPRVQISVHDAPVITALESATDNCVGDRLNFALSGTAPFSVFYTFEGAERKATSQTTTFRRLAEKPGTFTITGVQDSASSCRSSTKLEKRIHGMPSVRVSKGKDSYVDIHEGGEAEILFEFGGSPPFEFTYTRSSNSDKKGKSSRGVVLDMRSEISDEHSMRIAAHEEGTYEVVAIKDRFCAYSRPGVKVGEKSGQKKLGYY